MNIRLTLVTHDNIGSALLETCRNIFGEHPLPIQTELVSVHSGDSPEVISVKIKSSLSSSGSDCEHLILTDIFGATPCNIAIDTVRPFKAQMVSGLNLSMLLRIYSHPSDPLRELADTAVKGGIEGIFIVFDGETDD